ncbi:hypothetical protein CWE04_11455 [Thomasclavelia cocleata]|uniref:sigma-70 family RNA polymerase sigma factor n=1 Tax=Thomasclavelia cocleata TaxID=69824 RepID=UPI000C279793|nr:sigma-70 family RNA polymerase sigma factor [Thomasclavelia cocleata]PJN79821.1 hypothetical protein CWE04_11455 [Thomasclavelia cocleata]
MNLLKKNYPLFIWMVNKYNRKNYHTPPQDLIDYCLTTYLSYCQKFDVEKNVKFSYFLTKPIKYRINHYYNRNKNCKFKTIGAMSLNSEIRNENGKPTEFIELIQYKFNKFSNQNNHVLLNEILAYLKSNFSSRDLEMFNLYINGENQVDIAKRYSISQVQVSRVIKNIRTKIRNHFGFSN